MKRWHTLPLVALTLASGGCGPETPPPRAHTIVLVTVDTLRRDHVSAYVPAGGTVDVATPEMDALARRGLRFHDARTPTPLTLPAHTTMMCARPPAIHGVRTNSASRLPARADRPWPLLAEVLGAAGYCTGAFVSAGPLVERYGLSAGFTTYDDGALDDLRGGGYAERPGDTTVAHALAWLAATPRARPVFLWVHLFEPHRPYRPTYVADVAQADAVVGALLDGVARARGRDAAVLLTSDHGEALGALGEPSHGLLLAEPVMRVPFLLAGPGIPPAVRTDPVDLADVAPTLAGLAGVPFPAGDGIGAGRDLLAGPVPRSRPRVAEALHAFHQHRWAQLTCAVVDGLKLEDRGDAPGRRLLFRLDETGVGQDAGVDAAASPDATAPADALRAYLRAETTGPGAAGAPAGGYGGGGPVGRFLDPGENGRRPDPYTVVADAGRLDQIADVVLADPAPDERLRGALREVDALFARDPGNPSVAFWRGWARRRLARSPAQHDDARAEFVRALDLGRTDADTLLLAARSALARDDARGALTLLTTWDGRVPPDPRLSDLEADAAHRSGDVARQQRAADRAAAQREARRTPPGTRSVDERASRPPQTGSTAPRRRLPCRDPRGGDGQVRRLFSLAPGGWCPVQNPRAGHRL